MEISASPTDWSPTDGDNLAKFLDTDTGRRLIPRLAAAAPPLHEKGDTNQILIRTGEVRGFQNVLQELLFLAHPPAPVQSDGNNYPDLLDDSKWEGNKINDPKPNLL